MEVNQQALRRTEAKAFFANERTFLHWLNVSVTLGSISAAMLGVTGHVHKHWGSDYTKTAIAARVVALMMMITAIFMAAYSAFLFSSRSSLLKFKQDSGYESRVLPAVSAIAMAVVLCSVFSGAVDTYREAASRHRHQQDHSVPSPPAPPPPHHVPSPFAPSPELHKVPGMISLTWKGMESLREGHD